MRWVKIKFQAACLIGCTMVLCSCANIETRRIAVFDKAQGSIYFLVAGFNTSPITPEGPFPRWSNDLMVNMKPGLEIPQSGKVALSAGIDFTTRYDAVESGVILIDQDEQQIEVNLEYTKTYVWNRVRGLFPIAQEP